MIIWLLFVSLKIISFMFLRKQAILKCPQFWDSYKAFLMVLKNTIQLLFCRHSAIILCVSTFKRLFIDTERF